ERLPAWMLPSSFVSIDRLPVTANGKIDRAALPPASFGSESAVDVAPRTPTEAVLAVIWRDVLNTDDTPGIHDNFFHAGGHSRKAIRVVSRIRHALGVDVPLRALFDHPTIAGLAACLDVATPAPAPAAIPRRPGAGPCALSFAQERLWFLAQLAI